MNRTQNDYLKIGAFLIFSLFIFSSLNTVQLHKAGDIINSDVTAYYTYLPAIFIHHDLELNFVSKLPPFWHSRIWRYETRTGKSALKMTSGLAILYLPFFLLAHILALTFGFVPDGYSIPYSVMLLVASAFYSSLAFYYATKILSRFFRIKVALITSTLLIFATNVYIYSTSLGAYSHAFNFFLFAFFIWKTIKYYDFPTLKIASVLGITFGIITLIRPTNGLIALFFILYDVFSIKSFVSRVQFFLSKYKHILFLALFSFVVWVPQLFYWKFISGEFFHYSYQEEGFFFNNPRLIRGLFGFRKGWLIYTPIMVFALVGIIIMAFKKKSRRAFFLPMVLFVPLNIYIILSWWCWWYGGGFGQRPFIDSYSILAIPLAFMIEKGLSLNKWMKLIVIPICIFFVYLNLFQSWQYNNGILHYSDMTKSAYLRVWGKVERPLDYYCMLKTPDYDAAKFEGIDKSYYAPCLGEREFSPNQASIVKELGTKDSFRFDKNSFISIKYGGKVFKEKVSVTLDENDIYELTFFYKRKLLEKKLLYTYEPSAKGLFLYEYKLSSNLQKVGFDEIKIFPVDGDEDFYFGHLITE